MKNTILLFFVILLFNCSSDDSNNNIESSEWSVDLNDVSGRLNLFPLSLDPEFLSVSNTDLSDGVIVGVVSFGSAIRVFPYVFVRPTEIINTSYSNVDYAFSYCPITKSGIAFKRDQIFRASGYLYKDNLMPWDESTESIWSQMLGKGVNGARQNEILEKIPVLQTTWKTVRTYYPTARVLSRNSTSKLYRFPQEPNDDNDDNVELPFAGELTYGIVENNLQTVHFFRYQDFESSKRKDVIIQGQKYIVYGNATKRVVNAFKVSDFDSFQLLDDAEFPKILKSNNVKYDILGNSTGGASLNKPNFAYVAAWFAWSDIFVGYKFYPNQ